MKGSRIVKRSSLAGAPAESSHTVSLPLRIPGKRVFRSDGELDAADRGLGSSDVQILRSAHVMFAEPVELELTELKADYPVSGRRGDVGTDSDGTDISQTDERAWQEKLDDAVRNARAEGHRAGYDKARSELSDEYREKAARAFEDIDRLAAETRTFLENTEVRLVDLAFSVARTVVESPLLANARQASAEAISAAVERLAGQHHVRVRLHPVDYLRFQESGLVNQLSGVHADLRWEPDASVAPGDWTVESPEAIVRRLEHEIIEELRERLRLLAADYHRPHGPNA